MVDRDDQNLRATLDEDSAAVYQARPEEIAAGALIRRQSTQDPRGYANACRAMAALNETPLDPELPAIVARTVLVAGTADQHCPPRASQLIADRITGSELTVLDGAGHAIPVERPDDVAAAIERAAGAGR